MIIEHAISVFNKPTTGFYFYSIDKSLTRPPSTEQIESIELSLLNIITGVIG
jgi:hypothetical protein